MHYYTDSSTDWSKGTGVTGAGGETLDPNKYGSSTATLNGLVSGLYRPEGYDCVFSSTTESNLASLNE